MARKTNKRRQWLVPIQLSPQGIRGLLGHALPPPDVSAMRAPLVVDNGTRPTLLLGAARLAYHLQTRPQTLIEAVVVPVSDTALIDAVQSLEALVQPLPSGRARAVRALLDHGMGLAQMVQCVPGLGSASIASRWAALASADPYVLTCLDNELLAFSHAAQLVPLPHSDQRRWAEKCVAGNWSHAHLVRCLRRNLIEASARSDLDVHSHAQALGDRLSTHAQLFWDPVTAKTELVLEWFTIEDLQSLMERLGAAPPYRGLAPLPVRSRNLAIKLDSAEELDALTGHLFREDE